jgi:hypothetical protein
MRLEGQLQRLIGEGAAALFRDGRRLAEDGLGLEARATLVWHCAREIESAIRDALELVAPTGEIAEGASQHAAEIASIIKELDLPESDAAIAWWKTRPLAGLAHRANLGAPRPFAPADWQTFLKVLDLILRAFEERYARMIATLDGLLAMTSVKAGKKTKQLLCHVPPTGQTNALRHFFERADVTWLRVLPNCIFDDPPGREFAIDQPGYFQWPTWPASRYLATVARQEPDRVYVKVMQVLAKPPENPRIHMDFIAASAHFSPDKMAAWAMEEASWLRTQTQLFWSVAPEFANSTALLASMGLTDEAFALGEAVLALGSTPTQRGREPYLRGDDDEYGEALEVIAPALTVADARRASAFLVALVNQADEQAHPETRDRWSTLWRSSIADDGTNDSNDALDKLADALRDALESATTDESAVVVLHESLWAHAAGSSLFRRFAIHVATVGREFAPDLARATALDPATYTTDTRVEAHRLIEAIGAGLDADSTDLALAAIRSSTLAEPRQDELVGVLEGLRAGNVPEPIAGQPMFRTYPWVPPPSPVSAERMAHWSVPRTVRVLTKWQSDPVQHRDGDMLEAAFSEAVKANPSLWSGAGVKVLGLPPNFLLRYLWALRESTNDGATLKGNALVRLFVAGLITDRSWLGDEYRDVRHAAASILRYALGGERLSLSSSAARKTLWTVIGALQAEPSPATTHSSGGDVDELASAAIDDTSSIATTVVVAYALWLGRNRPGPRRLPEEGRRLLEGRLVASETSTVVRFAIGEQLVALRWLDPDWTDEVLPRIFPADEADALMRDAAWRGYLWRNNVPLDLFRALLPEYRQALAALDPAGEATNTHERLAEHVLLLARIGTIGPESDDGLLPLLLSRASSDLSRKASHNLGWGLYDARDRTDDKEEVARLRVLWDWLSAEVEGERADPASLQAFGWWFASAKFDEDWSLTELERLANGDVEIDTLHVVFVRLRILVTTSPARIGEVTQAIVGHEVRPNELRGDDLGAIVRVLIDDASGPDANAAGRAIIGMMVSRGYATFPGA